MKRIFFLLIIYFLSWTVCSAQDKKFVIESDLALFEKQLNQSLNIFTAEDWKYIRGKAEKLLSSQQLTQASEYSSKNIILSRKLEDNLLIARSYHLSGLIQSHLLNYQKAREYFQQSALFYVKTEKNAQNKLDVGFLLKDWAATYSSPEFINNREEIRTALFYLSQAQNIANSNTLPEAAALRVQVFRQTADCFAAIGNYLAQIVWLEKALAQMPTASTTDTSELFDVNFGLQAAYRALGSYEDAFRYLTANENTLKKLSDQNKKLKYLRHLADFYTQINYRKERDASLDAGIALSKKIEKSNALSDFYTARLFKSLEDKNLAVSREYLTLLEKQAANDPSSVNLLDVYVARAVIAGYQNQRDKSDSFFREAEKYLAEVAHYDWSNAVFLLAWQSKTASFQKNYATLKTVSEKYLEIASKNNLQDSLPLIFINLAEAYAGLGDLNNARKYNQSATELIESKRLSASAQISTGVMEGLYRAYQQSISYNLSESKSAEAFLASEQLKARWLNDKISLNLPKHQILIDEKTRNEIFQLSIKIMEKPEDGQSTAQLLKLERSAIAGSESKYITNSFSAVKNLTADFEQSPIDDSTAVISYVFADQDNLTAFVLQKGEHIRSISLNLTLDEIDQTSVDTNEKIKNFIFFKRDGKNLFDKLITPLALPPNVKHLIIVPDKSLWKIPFQALSADGEKYLIEDNLISYAPSVSILLEQMKSAKPNRQTLRAFANPNYNNQFLQYAASEAAQVAEVYNATPVQNATIADFKHNSQNSDILHFSMHAQIDSEQPLESFLGFRKTSAADDGRLTVDELLKIKLRKGSLAFLASCDTNNVLSGEGLVSLAWAMMGSGATTVVSAQWEADDKSTQTFTKTFYVNYKKGDSSAEALQKAALELIKNKSNEMHAPYYWANFTLNGDYR